MLNSLPVCLLVGTVLGVLAGLGVGGGSLLMLWLTLVLEMPQNQARLINLLFFLPAALISSFFRCRQGHLQLKKVLSAIIAGCIAAGAGTFLGRMLDLTVLRKLFGILLLATGIRELFYRPRNAK